MTSLTNPMKQFLVEKRQSVITMLLIPPTEEQKVHFQKSLNENPETRERDLLTVKEWLLKQPHLPDNWDERCLLTFLRGCKFSLEKCKNKLDMYFTVRAKFPEFFANRDIRRPELQKLLNLADAAVLPNLTPNLERVTVARVSKANFKTPDLADVFKVIFMAGDIRLILEQAVADVYIVDLDFPLAKHFFNAVRSNLSAIKKFFICVQEAYPIIIKEVHLINAPPFVDFAINFVKPFISETLRKTIFVHVNIETLYSFVPKDILPQDYGGKAANLVDLKNKWIEVLYEYSFWFEKEENVKADESKRRGKSALDDSSWKDESSFKELSID